MKVIQNAVPKKNQGGFTIVEALVVLGLFAAFIAAVVASTGGTTASQKAQTESRVINGAGKKLIGIYDQRANFNGLTTAAANSLEIFPDNMGDPAINSFGGAVTIVTPPANPKGNAPVAARQFEINWPNVTGDVCPELAALSQTDAIGVDVDGTEVYNAGVSPVDPVAIGANCAEGVTVTFVFGK